MHTTGAVAIIIALTVTNILGLTVAARLRTAMVLLLVGGLAIVVVAGFAARAAELTLHLALTDLVPHPVEQLPLARTAFVKRRSSRGG